MQSARPIQWENSTGQVEVFFFFSTNKLKGKKHEESRTYRFKET